jgi:hypothetical protein
VLKDAGVNRFDAEIGSVLFAAQELRLLVNRTASETLETVAKPAPLAELIGTIGRAERSRATRSG